MKMDLSQTISLSHLYTTGRCKRLYLLKLSTLNTHHIVTRCVGLSHITQVYQWTPKWCPTVPFSSDAGQVSGTQAESSVLTGLHSSGSVRGKYRQQSSKTPSCKLMILSAVGQKSPWNSGKHTYWLVVQDITWNTDNNQRKEVHRARHWDKSFLPSGYIDSFQTSRSSATWKFSGILTEPPIISSPFPLPRK